MRDSYDYIERQDSLLSMIQGLAQASGNLHDWGKIAAGFASKLDLAVGRKGNFLHEEAARHELISYRLLRGAIENGFDGAAKAIQSPVAVSDINSLKGGVVDAQSALEYIILTHHKLVGTTHQDSAGMVPSVINADAHIKQGVSIDHDGVPLRGQIDEALYSAAMSNLKTVAWQGGLVKEARKLPIAEGRLAWRLPATLARVAMILADHYVSSMIFSDSDSDEEIDPEALYANTIKDQSGVRFNQPLDWHLKMVGFFASFVGSRLLHSYQGLSDSTVSRILEPSNSERFAWQDSAVNFIKNMRDDSDIPSLPTLVFSKAGTGAGKTRANAKIACALSDSPRFCVALNLRSLTLQTGDSMRDDMGIQANEMSVVIGDKVVESLHQSSRSAFTQFSEDNLPIDVDGYGFDHEQLPDIIKNIAEKEASAGLIGPPILVSTIDFIINAAEPHKQGHHALALLRMLNSDLVLDELDSYEPKSMVAVLRLIQMSAMLGRNVICSSATMSRPVAKAVYEAFASGLQMNHFADKDSTFKTVCVDDVLQPSCLTSHVFASTEGFEAYLAARDEDLMDALAARKVMRKPVIVQPDGDDQESYYAAICEQIIAFHQQHQWGLGGDDDRKLSLGLVRIANVKNVISLARYLSENLDSHGVKVASYHANDLRIQRYMKERALDRLLTRKYGNGEHIFNDPLISEAFSEERRSVPFVVIATAVEEVGRDHDFDWAIIEPSSAQSIVQTAGRVNRHRLVEVTDPNVAIMDTNIRKITAKKPRFGSRAPCFQMPGIETKKHLYSSVRVSDMLFKDKPFDRIDAQFRLGSSVMGNDEDRIIEKRLADAMNTLLEMPGHEGLWMTHGFYKNYPLRDMAQKDLYCLRKNSSGGHYDLYQMVSVTNGTEWVRRKVKGVAEDHNAWLSWSLDELLSECQKKGLSEEQGMSFELLCYSKDRLPDVVFDPAFGIQYRY